MLRVLPYLGGILTIVLLFFLAVLVYRYATRNDRLAPKRALRQKCERLEVEQGRYDELLEELVDIAIASKPTEPLLADQVVIKISGFRSEQSNRRKELSR